MVLFSTWLVSTILSQCTQPLDVVHGHHGIWVNYVFLSNAAHWIVACFVLLLDLNSVSPAEVTMASWDEAKVSDFS